MKYLLQGFRTGINLNHHFKTQVLILGELREDTVVDLSLTCAMLRTLFSLGTLHCLGFVTITDRKDEALAASHPVESLKGTLRQLGLSFVPVFTAEDDVTAAKQVHDLYKDALPIGVTL